MRIVCWFVLCCLLCVVCVVVVRCALFAACCSVCFARGLLFVGRFELFVVRCVLLNVRCSLLLVVGCVCIVCVLSDACVVVVVRVLCFECCCTVCVACWLLFAVRCVVCWFVFGGLLLVAVRCSLFNVRRTSVFVGGCSLLVGRCNRLLCVVACC